MAGRCRDRGDGRYPTAGPSFLSDGGGHRRSDAWPALGYGCGACGDGTDWRCAAGNSDGGRAAALGHRDGAIAGDGAGCARFNRSQSRGLALDLGRRLDDRLSWGGGGLDILLA